MSDRARPVGLPAGLVLPDPPRPAGAYRPAAIWGDMIFLSGLGPRTADGSPLTGMIGRDITLKEGQAAARNTGASILTVLQNSLGTLDRVRQVLRLTGMVWAVPEFTQHPSIVDGCSQLLLEVLGQRGTHARMAYGVASLPFGAPVAIDCICAIEP